ncbi:hypothetical protein TEK04_02710 [Klenkia sp. LSe6-5]|uniref:SPW repeat-containing protein n=1 Tax=Klenkia sesuvii TaxID=3103137 RepID=A0ABU8DP78_9ACTN
MRRVVTLGWGVLAAVVAAWLAVVEVLWLPLRVGPVPVPVSVLAAAAGNVLLVAWALRLSGSRVVAVLPVLVWVVVAVGASVRRPEGDLLITGATTASQWVGLGFLLVGVLFGSFSVGRVLSRPRAGSGTGGAR